MNVMNQMMDQLTAQMVNQMGTKSVKVSSGKDSSDFDRLVKKFQSGQSSNKQTAKNQTAADSKNDNPAADNGVGANEEPTDELRAVAAALGMQMPVAFVDVQTVQDPAAEQTAVLTENVVQTGAADLLPEQAAQTEEPVVEVLPQAETPVETVAQPQQTQAQTEDTGAQTDNSGLEQSASQEDDQPVENVTVHQNTPVFHEVESTPVKVGETYEPVPLESEEGVQNLADQLVNTLAQGESRVEISLTPENLGKLTVEITRAGDGTLSIVLNATTEKASNLLQQHSGSLQNLLAANTQADVRVEVRGNENAQQQFLNPDDSQQQNRQQQNQQHKHREQQTQDFIQQLRLGLIQQADVSEL